MSRRSLLLTLALGLLVTLVAGGVLLSSPALSSTTTNTETTGPVTIFQAGVDDNFAPPDDPAIPSDNFAAWLSSVGATTKDFDDPTIDRFVAHTFTGLPQDVCKATLEIGLRGGGANDGVTLMFIGKDQTIPPIGSKRWTRRIGTSDDVPGLLSAPWQPGTAATLMLDLGNLPLAPTQPASAGNLIPAMRKHKSLDFYVQDDTNVDYLTLTVFGGCDALPTPINSGGTTTVFQAGENDDFELTTEPTSQSVNFAAWLDSVGATTKDFDDPTIDQFVAHTFTGLPQDICKATLEIGLKAGASSLSVNDGVNLTFIGKDQTRDSTIWGRRIGTLTNAPGLLPDPWQAPASATLMLDLGNLPLAPGQSASTNFIPAMSKHKSLDFYVQDDTTVDYVTLTITAGCKEPIAPPGVTAKLSAGESLKVEATLHVPESVGDLVQIDALTGSCNPLDIDFEPPFGSVEPPAQVEFSMNIRVPPGAESGKISCTVRYLADDFPIAEQAISITVNASTPTITPTITPTFTPTATLTATPTFTPTATATPDTKLGGDVNCDGVVNALDALLLLQFIAGLIDDLPQQGGC